jgi:hypothetical protein
MPLFIDRLPFHRWTDQTQAPPATYWAVALPVLVTEVGLPAPPPAAAVQEWFFDTGHASEAFAWRHHLVQAGLDPDQRRAPNRLSVISSAGGRALAHVREADFWLASNVPALQGSPFRMRIDRGVPFLNTPARPDPHYQRPLLGMRVFRRAGLRVELDFAADAVSIWTP